MTRIEELEKILEKVCGQYENDCSKCPKEKNVKSIHISTEKENKAVAAAQKSPLSRKRPAVMQGLEIKRIRRKQR